MEEQEVTISRRKVLKGLGAGTAIAWAAPLLLSIKTPAYAQASPGCAPVNCADFEYCGPDADCPLGPGCTPGVSFCTVLVDNTCFCSNTGICDACQSDTDCVEYGPGTRCGLTTPDCPCGAFGNRACFLPCESSSRPPRGKKVVMSS